jgi:hypothetical protein
VKGLERFRRSTSRKARGVSQTLDKVPQNSGEKFVDLVFLVGGSSCDGSSARCLFRFWGRAMAMAMTDLDCRSAMLHGGIEVGNGFREGHATRQGLVSTTAFGWTRAGTCRMAAIMKLGSACD